MIPKVSRGSRLLGLMAYLVGPGLANEHSDPHLVAGDAALMTWHGDEQLDAHAAAEVARYVDRPERVHPCGVAGGYVWHCSLSLRADEGQLTDDQWRVIAEQFVGKMGFSGEGGCRWVAVRHGVSKNGNDHVHVVVNLAREDGGTANIGNDYRRAQTACRELEKQHGLRQVGAREHNRSERGWQVSESHAHARRRARTAHEAGKDSRSWEELPKGERDRLIDEQRKSEQPRWELARRVRGCAAASENEAEFVRRVSGSGLLLRPRFAAGRDDVITGFSVAFRPPRDEHPVWYGGGHLSRDLTLPRLRQAWPDDPVCAQEAAKLWRAVSRGRPLPAIDDERDNKASVQQWVEISEQLGQLRQSLRNVPAGDRVVWAQVAKETAGVFAAWSLAWEPTAGPLADASRALANAAQLRYYTPKRSRTPSLAAAGLLVASASVGSKGAIGQAVMLRQLLNLAKAVHDARVAVGDAHRAEMISRSVREQLVQVMQRLTPENDPAHPPQHDAWRAVAASAPSLPGSPVETKLSENERSQVSSSPKGWRKKSSVVKGD